MFATMKNTAAAALAALSIAAIPAPVHAWGKKEQGFVAGVATAIIVDELLKQSRRQYYVAPAPAPRPAPVYAEPRPTHATSIYATPAARAFNSYSGAERKAIQRSLRASGYYGGGIDGSFGPGTYRAITAYARDYGASGNLQTTGGSFALYDGLIF